MFHYFSSAPCWRMVVHGRPKVGVKAKSSRDFQAADRSWSFNEFAATSTSAVSQNDWELEMKAQLRRVAPRRNVVRSREG